jgi:hypothetical protein
MEDDSRAAPLSRRAPGDSGGPRPPAGTAPPVLSQAALRVAQAALDAAREHDPGTNVAVATAEPEGPGAPWFAVDPEADTQPIPVVTAAAATAAPAGPPGRRRYRLAGVLVSVLVLLGAGSLALALSWHPAGNTASAAAAASQQAIRDSAAAWVSHQVSPGAVVSCDPAMCQALQAHGRRAGSLLTLGPAGVTPLSSEVVMATQTVRAEFGARLGSFYAPLALASFGSGNLRIDVRVVAPYGAAAYLAAVKADQQARVASGAQLLRTERIKLPDPARAQLVHGQVDARLLVVLANLAALQPVSVVGFGPATPGASPGVPLRIADLAVPRGNGPGSAQSMISILREQTGLYVPADIQTLRLGHGRSVLRVQFSAPSPLGLLGPLTSGDRGRLAGHDGQVTAALVGAPLENSAVAAHEYSFEQAAHGRAVTHVLQRLTDVPEQGSTYRRRLLGLAGERAEQRFIQAGAAGPPGRQPQ